METEIQKVKCILVGDTGVGKTSFLLTYLNKSFPGEYIPSVRDDRPVNIIVDNTLIRLDLWDSHGSSDYDRIRYLTYENVKVVLLCFSLIDHASFEHVRTKWHPEVVSQCPGIPFLLVGTKLDLREDNKKMQSSQEEGVTPLTFSEGEALLKEIDGMKYIECSAMLQKGTEDVINEAMRAVINKKHPKKKSICNIF